MAVWKRWVNWATSVTSAVLLLFCLALVIISFYMNLTTVLNKEEKLAISGASLVSLGVLVFPTAWVGFASAISRHRGVYIAFIVMASLSLLDSIGMLAYQTFRFSTLQSYNDTEKGIAITMTVLQCLLTVILIFAVSFGAAGLCVRRPYNDHPHGKKSSNYPAYPGYYGTAPPMYSREYGPPLSLPRARDYEYSTEPRAYYSKGRY